jgi:hypothetical protein
MTSFMPTDLKATQSVAIDSRSLSDLKVAAKKNSPEALNQAAKQFEALFGLFGLIPVVEVILRFACYQQ